jgi:Fe-S-cluster containining protein
MKRDVRKQRALKSKRRGCSCPKCIECCERDPGWFMPGEVAIAAAYLGMPEGEFIRRYCKENVFDDAIVISPAARPGKTSCIFLTRDGRCEIHDVKPHECKKVFGCHGEARHRRIREMIKKAWGK